MTVTESQRCDIGHTEVMLQVMVTACDEIVI